jgi:hypothetical protein
VGDDTPMTAVHDHVRAFDPDHLLLVRSREHADWQERGLIERIESETGIPLTVLEIDPPGPRAIAMKDGRRPAPVERGPAARQLVLG